MEAIKSIVNPLSSFFVICILLLFANAASAETHYHDFVIQATTVKRLCKTHNIITVNGQFPRPTLEVNNDGPGFITQCPIRPGKSYTYRFTIQGQEGTLWWHAHSSWLRASVYGALIIHPKEGEDYPFPKPQTETPILLGEWWDTNPIDVIRTATTFNGQPVLMLGPGQTTDVLITADQQPARYYMAACAYASARGAPFDNTTTTAILEYKTASCSNCVKTNPIFPSVPAYNDTASAAAFTTKFRSARKVEVPMEIDENLFFTVGLGLSNCPRGAPSSNCQGPNGTRFTASMNNVSFVLPSNFSLLQAHHRGIPGVFSTDFPTTPSVKFDYTGNVSRSLWQPIRGTKLYKLKADTAKFNLVDPPLRNTASVPVNGWAVIRFVPDNPGVCLMHCHLDVHITWGLAMAFLVENGVSELESLEAPPVDLPVC
ncbi:Laccase-12 [Capsicum chinense]|nr:Laccase-12 [Capsicum chinense]